MGARTAESHVSQSTDACDRLTVSLPWPVLVSDNDKYGVIGGRMILTSRYRKAKDSAHQLAQLQCLRNRVNGRIRITATVYEPDRDKARDISNWEKLTHDSLIDAAYEDDSQIDDVHWIRGPVDRARPRLDIVIERIG